MPNGQTLAERLAEQNKRAQAVLAAQRQAAAEAKAEAAGAPAAGASGQAP